MDKSAVLETLVSSEKKRSIVTIKTIYADKPVTGLVEKVLNHVIILRSGTSSPLTLTFADIESVIELNQSNFTRVYQLIRKTLHKRIRLS